MKNFFLVLFLSLSGFFLTQADTLTKHEIGLDCFVNASSLGGSFGVGVKYALVKNEKLVFGPSLRIQRTWNNSIGQKYGFTIFGGGAFVHYRINNALFGGVELEFLRSPTNYSFILSPKTLVPTCFVGGGYSHEFESIGIRLNAGVFYDIIHNNNSPFWNSYVAKTENGVPIPIIYRIGFFFPLD